MATRTIESLDPHSDCVEEWIDRFENMAYVHDAYISGTTNEIKAARLVNILLSTIGKEGYRLLKAYLAPEEPRTKSYEELKKCLMDNLAPKKNVISESFQFSQIRQEASETLAIYMSRVKLGASKCEFGTGFERAVRDKFISGIRNEKLREHLVNDSTLTTSALAFKKAVERENSHIAAHSMNVNSVQYNKQQSKPSTSFKQNKNFSNQKGSSSSNQKGNSDSNNVICSKCTIRGHIAPNCRTKCRYCHQPGHIVVHCPKANKKKQSVNTCHVKDGTCNMANVKESQDTTPVNSVSTEPFDYCFRVSYQGPKSPVCNVAKHMESKGEIGLEVHSKMCSNVEIVTNVDSQNLNSTITNLNNDSNYICNHDFDTIDLPLFEIKALNHKGGMHKKLIKLLINGKHINMEVDSGSDVSCMSKATFENLNLTGAVLTKSKVGELVVASGHSIPSRLVYTSEVYVTYKDIQHKLVLRVVDSQFPTLMGRNWMDLLFGSDWFDRLITVNRVESIDETRKAVMEKLQKSPVFQPGVGRVSKHVANLDLKQDFRPKFCKARPVAYSEKEEIGLELDRLESVGYYAKVNSSEWASPIVPVRKCDGGIRLCGDYKKTLNPSLDTKIYPLPVVEDCFVEMKGGQHFTKIDIKQAYNSIPLREQDQLLATINTHQGLYKPLVLPFGVSSSSAIFQSIIDEVLKGIKHTICRVDDILITGTTTKEHLETLYEVVRRLEECGFKCRWDKSGFLQEMVVYNGYEISREGVRPCRSKVETLREAPYPENLEQLVILGSRSVLREIHQRHVNTH